MAFVQKSKQHIWLVLLLMVLGSNLMLYRTEFGANILENASQGIVIGSMLDLVIIAPILYLAWKKQKSMKLMILMMAGGLILVRVLIPMQYLGSFAFITWAGFAVEAGLLIIECLLLVAFVKYLPSIIRATKSSQLLTLFAFPREVDNYVKKQQLIHIICSEMLMFYYAFFSWRKKPLQTENTFTIYKKSSYIAFQMMLIHAIVIETLGLHWWLHEKSMIVSLVLLLLNLYTVIFFLADLQAVRLNPVQLTDSHLYISLGLTKRITIRLNEIETVITDGEKLLQKTAKDTVDFVARDFEEAHPNVILQLKEPKEATLIMGLKKEYRHVAVKFDHPQAFQEAFHKYYEKQKEGA